MKNLSLYANELKLPDEDAVFNHLVRTLKPSSMLWAYFVNWDKVFANTRELEVALNVLNYLIGKDNFDAEFKKLVREHPEVIPVIPALAVRVSGKAGKLTILVDYKNKKLTYEEFDFSSIKPSNAEVEKYLGFVNQTGLKALFEDGGVKNLVDYMVGVEAGLDSNARKNRGGDAMEEIMESFIKAICADQGYEYLKEANSVAIKKAYGHEVPFDKSSRRYDFVVNTPQELFLIETNFYGGGGSKLKSTAGEYRNLYDTLAGQYKFIWVTDGPGWYSTLRPLRETFNHNDYVFNLDLVENGVLESVLSREA